MAIKIHASQKTVVGCVRDHNEDALIAAPEHGLWLIADGMGGHEAGEIASEIVCKSIFDQIEQKVPLVKAVHNAHATVKQSAVDGIGKPDMGATVVAVQFHDDDYLIAWVGDSRAYLWDGHLMQLTRDHSFVQNLIDVGAITTEQAAVHPHRNLITQSLGANDLTEIKVDSVKGKLKPGQKLLLCSDGLNGELSDELISKLLAKDYPPENIADNLVEAAVDAGGHDNISVILLHAESNGKTVGVTNETQPIDVASINRKLSYKRMALLVASAGLIASVTWLIWYQLWT